MRVEVIGGGSAFSEANSSFLIHIGNMSLLFDCSETSFNFIKQNNIPIEYVVISHTHMDHIGGLEKLIFYNYFVKGVITKIYAHKDLNIDKFLPKQVIYENGELIKVKMYEVNHQLGFFNNHDVKWIKGNHIVLPNYGISVYSREHDTELIITGDTKATPDIRDYLHSIKNQRKKIVIFHDYQFFGSSFNSIHCCHDDFGFYYKDLLEVDNIKWFKYHNDDFDTKYKGKIIKI